MVEMSGVRWGLCCQFVDAPIKFRTATHRYVAGLAPEVRREYLAAIVRDNAAALAAAAEHCHALGIGAFRITSQFFPLATHPLSGYTLDTLDPTGALERAVRAAGGVATRLGVRLSFHPDQFVVLNSENPRVVESSLGELAAQGALAALLDADVLTLHGGSMAGGKEAALLRLAAGVARLAPAARERLALENDDRLFTVADLLPVCERLGVPLVYDVHHHRCNPDGLTVAEATARAAATWGEREPWAHISSPRDGWAAPNPRPHAGGVDPADFPDEWLGRRLTIDVEAKDKERAVLALRDAMAERAGPARSARRSA
jgi:UV DNA damage endonuclease